VISGLLISKSYEHSDSLRDYLRNRSLRIFPGLWVCLAVSVAAIPGTRVRFLGRVTAAPDWLLVGGTDEHFSELSRALLEPLSTGALNGSQWTIPIELEFAFFCLFSIGSCSCEAAAVM
jgi:peptidoglycan/LPS O-acetylase OafA/YrhL